MELVVVSDDEILGDSVESGVAELLGVFVYECVPDGDGDVLPDIDGDPDAELVKDPDGVDDVDIITDLDVDSVAEDAGDVERTAVRLFECVVERVTVFECVVERVSEFV